MSVLLHSFRGAGQAGRSPGWRRLALRVALAIPTVVAVGVGMLLLVAAPASASVTIGSFTAVPSTTQAGGHPDIATRFGLSSRNVEPTPCACNDTKDIDLHLPAGVISNPHATPQCSLASFAAEQCPVDSQVGIVAATVSLGPGIGTGQGLDFVAPVFNLIPPPDEAGLLAFKSSRLNTPTFEIASPRTSTDYGLDLDTVSIQHTLPLVGFEQITWGVPSAPIHDYLRFGLGEPPATYGTPSPSDQPPTFCDRNGEPHTADPTTVFQLCSRGEQQAHPAGDEHGGPGGPVPSQSPEVPFIQNPTTCADGSLATSLDILAYDGGETHADGTWPPTTDCAQLSFNPSQAIEPTTTAADSPSGSEAHLVVPQFESPSVPSPSELRAAVITLPKGFSLAPNAVNGKLTCTEVEAGMGAYASPEEGHCPEDSKIGTITIETPVLPGPLLGAAYLGESKPGQRFRIFLLVDGFGVHIKLVGVVTPDPLTGQVRLEFPNLPQAPFADFNLHVFGSERGPLDTPTQCGRYEVSSEWTPWDSALSNQVSRQFFEITKGPDGTPCPDGPRPFHPGFSAASAASTGGAHTAFSIDLARNDGEQNLKALNVTTPPGFAATLKGLTYCPQTAIAAAALETHLGLAEQQSPSCPASSLVGELTAGAGPGIHPLYLPGKVYLAGPYRGAPLSLVFITPAVSGGYDLGNVVIRAALDINPETAQVTAVSDPLPQIYQGIPLRLRQIFVNLNRPDFALNPTNCDPFSVDAQVFGDEGAVSHTSTHFQVSNCASLAFKPKLALKLSGPTRRGGNPALKATVTYPSAPYANIAKAEVSLPHSEFLDQAHIGTVCTRPELAAEKCPAASVYGHASVETPLLEKPLEGPVYLGTGYGTKLPELIADLNGQIHIILRGKVTTDREGGIRSTFEAVPDAPVSKFTISLDGGKKGLLENSESLCAKPQRATADFTGQNGKVDDYRTLISNSCGGKGKKHKRNGADRADKNGGTGR